MSATAVESAASEFRLPELMDLMRRAVLEVGLPEEEAWRAAEENRFTLADVEVQLALSTDETALVLSAEAGTDTLDTTQKKRLALECTLTLAMSCGVAIGWDCGRAVLSCRWSIDEDGVEQLASCIGELVGMTLAVRRFGVGILVKAMSTLQPQRSAS